jgi:hypothetical protein
MPCPHCGHPEREDEQHGYVPVDVSDWFGRPLPPACYDDEGTLIPPAEEEPTPAADVPRLTIPDPWMDPDAAAAHQPPPF